MQSTQINLPRILHPSCISTFLPYYSSVNESAQNLYISRLVQDLRAGDADAFLNRIKVFFYDFPYELNEKNECHYQLVLCLVLKLVGQFMEVEVRCVSGGVKVEVIGESGQKTDFIIPYLKIKE